MAQWFGQFYDFMQYIICTRPLLCDPWLASRLFMQISCPILAIVQHKVTIANK